MDTRGAFPAFYLLAGMSSDRPSQMVNCTFLALALQEDILLKRLVESFGPQKWSVIAEKIKVRAEHLSSPLALVPLQ